MDTGLKEKCLSSHPINQDNRHNSRRNINNPCNDSRHEGGVITESDSLEQYWCIEHDGVDPGELLEDLHEDGNDKLRPGLALHQVPEGVFHLVRHLTCVHNLPEFCLHILSPSNFPEGGLALLLLAAFDQAGWRLWDHQRAKEQKQGRDSGEAKGCSPSPWMDLLHEVVDQVCD